jgi:hypothetical protein
MQNNTATSRLDNVRKFYQILTRLEVKLGGSRKLGHAYESRDWPRRGVYFFFEVGEMRTTSGSGPNDRSAGITPPGIKMTCQRSPDVFISGAI